MIIYVYIYIYRIDRGFCGLAAGLGVGTYTEWCFSCIELLLLVFHSVSILERSTAQQKC